MSLLDRTSKDPLHKQVEQQVRSWIADGRYRPGQRLPSIRELSAQLGVNYLTARQAVKRLAAEGLLASNQGRGTYVRQPTERSRKVGLIVPHLGKPLIDTISTGIYAVLAEHEVGVTILSSYDNSDIEVQNIDRAEQSGLQGTIVFSLMGLRSTLAILRMINDGLAVVMVDRHFEDVPTWHVCSDHQGGAYMATRHLVEIGRRRVAFVSDITNLATRQRLEGYRSALIDGGLPLDQKLVGAVPVKTNDTAAVTRDLLASKPYPDAIFFGNDLRALEGMQVIKEKGLRIPDDIAVVGFDDLPMARLADPPLTTIRQDGEKLGRVAAELYLEQVALSPDERRFQPQSRMLPVEMVRRASA